MAHSLTERDKHAYEMIRNEGGGQVSGCVCVCRWCLGVLVWGRWWEGEFMEGGV